MSQALRKLQNARRAIGAEQFFSMGAPGPCELIEGEVVSMSPSGGAHGNVVFVISGLLAEYVRRTRAGQAFGAETGFILQRDPDTVRAPDCAFVRSHRIPARGIPEDFFPGAPDLAIEVLSPGDHWPELRRKAAEYLEAGARAVWLVHPRSRVIEAHEPGGVRIYRGKQWVTAGAAAPGFRLRVDRAFEGLGARRP